MSAIKKRRVPGGSLESNEAIAVENENAGRGKDPKVAGSVPHPKLDSEFIVTKKKGLEVIRWKQHDTRHNNIGMIGCTLSTIATALNNAIKTSASAEMAILHFMNQYEINWQDLKRHIEYKALDINFSRVTWDQVTRLVGITPYYGLARVPVFQLQRARIPRQLFRSIVQDIDRNNTVYGALRAHHNVEAHSSFISPVFIRIVDLFGSSITGIPETLLQGRIARSGQVEHQFCTISGISLLLLIEVKYKIGNPTERLDAVAQVIAEAGACDYRNQAQNYNYPVYCVLFDGESFMFFKYDRNLDPKFWQGKLDSSSEFTLTDSRRSPRQFIEDLRPICEVVFALLLTAHAQALRTQAETDSEVANPAWMRGAEAADKVVSDCLQATSCADKNAAEQLAEQALKKLSSSIKLLPAGAAPGIDLMEYYSDED